MTSAPSRTHSEADGALGRQEWQLRDEMNTPPSQYMSKKNEVYARPELMKDLGGDASRGAATVAALVQRGLG